MSKKNIQRSFNILGSVAVVNFPDNTYMEDKKKFAEKLLKKNPVIKISDKNYGEYF